MYVLQERSPISIAYLKYEGWHVFRKDTPLDLTGCILFTQAEVALNPPKIGQTYQHWGCYAPIKEETNDQSK